MVPLAPQSTPEKNRTITNLPIAYMAISASMTANLSRKTSTRTSSAVYSTPAPPFRSRQLQGPGWAFRPHLARNLLSANLVPFMLKEVLSQDQLAREARKAARSPRIARIS